MFEARRVGETASSSPHPRSLLVGDVGPWLLAPDYAHISQFRDQILADIILLRGHSPLPWGVQALLLPLRMWVKLLPKKSFRD